MKKITLLTAAIIIATNLAFSQGTAINTTGAAADASALLDVSSTSKGILIPRMIKSEKLAIPSPANGLLVYQTDDTTGFWYFNSVKWVQAIGSAGTTGGGSCGFTHFLVYGSNSTFSVPAGITQVMIEAWGGGGGGGYSNNSYPKTGGGGGGYAKIVANVTPGDVLTITVGAAGQTCFSSPCDGTPGGLSKVDNPTPVTLVTAFGGGGSPQNGIGGSASVYGNTSVVPYSVTASGGDSYSSTYGGGNNPAGGNGAGGGGQGSNIYATGSGKVPGGGGHSGNGGGTNGGAGRVIIYW